jgi:hypothetical protein
MSLGDPAGRDPGLAGPGPVVDSSVVDRNGAAVSVTIIVTRAVSKVRIQLVPDTVPASQASSASRLTYLRLAEPAK